MNRVVGISGREREGTEKTRDRTDGSCLPRTPQVYPVCLVSLYRRTADSRFLKNAQTCQRAFSRPRIARRPSRRATAPSRRFLAVGSAYNDATPCICPDLFIFSAYCNSHHWFSNCGYVRKFRIRDTRHAE